MKKSLLIFFSILLPLSLLIVGCENNQDKQKNNKQLTVYTTVYPLQYFTDKIGGEYVEVDTIYPPGADEHTFEPTQRDMMNLVDADLFFYVGLGLEGFVDKAKATLKNEDVKMISTAENIHLDANPSSDEHESEQEEEEEEEDHHHSVDPHVWLDPVYAQDLAKSIKDALVAKMPEQKDSFEQNYQELTKDLAELNQSFIDTTKSAKYKEIVVAHAAYGYWEQRYGIEQISISGLSTTNEPSQKKLEEIVARVKQDHIKYIIFEQNNTSKLTKIVEEEVGAKSLTLHNLSVLTKENINNKDDYFTIMDKNLQTLNKALND